MLAKVLAELLLYRIVIQVDQAGTFFLVRRLGSAAERSFEQIAPQVPVFIHDTGEGRQDLSYERPQLRQVHCPDHQVQVREHDSHAQDGDPEAAGEDGQDRVEGQTVRDAVEQDTRVAGDDIDVVPGTGIESSVFHNQSVSPKMGISFRICKLFLLLSILMDFPSAMERSCIVDYHFDSTV